jgi:hypothetical protein
MDNLSIYDLTYKLILYAKKNKYYKCKWAGDHQKRPVNIVFTGLSKLVAGAGFEPTTFRL